MIIRLSAEKDVEGIISLWNEAFGDGENEIRFFLDNKYIPENTLIIEENGKIASMLFLLEGNMHIKGKIYPSYYLYAACTLKEFRGRGYMSVLLEKANEIASIRNRDFICLMPGEKTLFEFYEKHGYTTAFSKKVLTVNKNECEKINLTDIVADGECEKIRNAAFADFDYFEWDKFSVEFAFWHNEMYFGHALTMRNGYCLYSANGADASVKEFAFTEENFSLGVSSLFYVCGCERAEFLLPSEYKTNIGNYKIVPSAMLYPVSKRSKTAAEGLSNAYLGLTLD